MTSRAWAYRCAAGGCDDGHGRPVPADYYDTHGHPVCVECCGMPPAGYAEPEPGDMTYAERIDHEHE